MSQNSHLEVNVSANLQSAIDLVTGAAPLVKNKKYDLVDGAGANKAEDVFSDTRTLAASATEDLDLSGGLSNIFGVSLTFTKIKALIIAAAAANTNDVDVGGAATNQFVTPFGDVTDVVSVKPGGVLALIAPDAAGYAVAAGTGDLLKIANSAAGTGVTYDIIIIGETS